MFRATQTRTQFTQQGSTVHLRMMFLHAQRTPPLRDLVSVFERRSRRCDQSARLVSIWQKRSLKVNMTRRSGMRPAKRATKLEAVK